MAFENGFANIGARVRVAGRKIWAPLIMGSLIFGTLTHAASEHGDAPPTDA